MGDKWDGLMCGFDIYSKAVSVLLNWTSIDSTGVNNNRHFSVRDLSVGARRQIVDIQSVLSRVIPIISNIRPRNTGRFWILGKSKSQRLNEIWKHNSSSLDLLHSFRASERRAWASRIVYMPLAHVCTGSPGTTTSNQTLEHSRWEADLSRLVCVFIHLKCFSPSVPHRLNVVGGSVNTLICFLLNCI